jgi:hypothetical protein
MLIKKKAKQSHNTFMGIQGERRHSSYSFKTTALYGVSGQRHASAVALPLGKDHRHSLYKRQGGPQSRSGHRV